MNPPEQAGESITAEGLEALQAELDELEGTRRRDMAERIKAARELGDLSENAEYHIAKEDQAHLETKILRTRERLRLAVVEEVDDGAKTFAFGRTAKVKDEESGKVHTWTLVGAGEADPGEGRISVETPVGSALRDLAVGKSVKIETPSGAKTYSVKSLVD